MALALAGTAPYTLASGEQIVGASGQDAGDKTGIVTQRIFQKPGSYTYADYQEQQSLNPHGLREANIIFSVREYPEVAYTDVGTVFTALSTYLGDPMKGQIQVAFDKGKGVFAMLGRKEGTPDWDNDGETPEYVQVAVENSGTWAEAKTEEATGVPIAGATAIVSAASADEDYILDRTQMQDRGRGEAVITKHQRKKDGEAFYTREEPGRAEGTGERKRERKITVWQNVHPDEIATVWAAAEDENVDATHVLEYREKLRPDSGGFYTVRNCVVETTTTGWLTNYYGWQTTRTYYEYDHQYWRKEWRCILVTIWEYRGQTYSTALATYQGTADPMTGYGEKDSVEPTIIGYVAGASVYRSTNVKRTYSEWRDNADATKESCAHTDHGPFDN